MNVKWKQLDSVVMDITIGKLFDIKLNYTIHTPTKDMFFICFNFNVDCK